MSRQWPVKVLLPSLDPICPQLSCAEFDLFRIQYLPEDEKDHVQNFCNWVQSDSDSTTQSAPKYPIIGLIENSAAAGISGTTKELIPEAVKSSPSAATGETRATSAGIGSDEAGGLGKHNV